MKTDELREAYLTFFESKGHVRRPSDVLVPKGDPTVLFTGAGMNQFKAQFLGIGKLEFTRVTTCQKCLRTGDIENVGRTDYHETFFEMLGNFSFGDYFKREAIVWAWEFLLKVLKLDPQRLSVSVYQDDDEAYAIWAREIGLPPERISRRGEDENFWPASAPSQGPNGVCGPCSEIFFRRDDGVAVEIWNLVFTQFNRRDGGVLEPLPNRNIDTGMGMERTAAVLQGVRRVFETDVFRPILAALSEIVGRPYGRDELDSQRMRRIADHARAVTFCVHENVFPDREKQGYVVRRLLRRAVLDGHRLGVRGSFVHRLCPVVAAVMKVPYPEVAEHIDRTATIVRLEEERFLETLEVGTRYLDDAIERLVRDGQRVLSGADAFRLHATYGFPVELTESILLERGLGVDRAEFERLMTAHQQGSRDPNAPTAIFVSGPIDELKNRYPGTTFLGYDTTEAAGVVRGLVVNERLVEARSVDDGPGAFVVVLDQTPFYGEAGGQVGDTGRLVGAHFEFQVDDTRREGDYVLHVGRLGRGTVRVGDTVRAVVDADRRAAIRRAHSATHLLHTALRQTLGRHAQQKGSRVEPDLLRFDFTHFQAITAEQLEAIQREVNAHVREAAPVVTEVMPLEEARRRGVTALFEEKYKDVVRVVRMGDFSAELCGGTHLENTGQVGLVKIVSEESSAAGVRRITAVTGPKAVDAMLEADRTLSELAAVLKAPVAALVERAAALVEETRRLRREASRPRPTPAGPSAADLLAEADDVHGVAVVLRGLGESSPDVLRRLLDQLRGQDRPVAAMLGTVQGGKVQLFAGLSRQLTQRGLDAVEWVRVAARCVGGSGGGRSDMAQAGGKDPSQMEAALAEARRYIRQRLEADADRENRE